MFIYSSKTWRNILKYMEKVLKIYGKSFKIWEDYTLGICICLYKGTLEERMKLR